MLIKGRWGVGDDGEVRPIISGEALAADGAWKKVDFLVDTGADKTVFSADVLAELGLQDAAAPGRLAGVGGPAASVLIDTSIRLEREDATPVAFHGGFAAFTDQNALEVSVLGRDIMRPFALIVDRPRHIVCLLNQRHQYVIQTV